MAPLAGNLGRTQTGNAEDDLTFLWRETKIPLELQARMIEVGFTELSVFAKMANTEEDMEAIIDKEFGF